MLEDFSFHVRRESLYCHKCREIKPHEILSRTDLDLSRPVAPDHRLMSRCCGCGTTLVLFADDFRAFFPDEIRRYGCKIPGRSRIVVRDLLYVKGSDRLGRVYARSRSGTVEKITLEFDQNIRREIEIPFVQEVHEETSRVYLLVPQFTHCLKIGDWIYHTQYEVAGRMVGIIHGRKDQAIILLENDTYLLLKSAENSGRVLEDTALLPKVCDELRKMESDAVNALGVLASHGVVYLRGQLPSLPLRDRAVARVERIPGVLVVVPKLAVVPEVLRADAEILDDVQRCVGTTVSEARISVRRGHVEIYGRAMRPGVPEALYSRVSEIAGVASVRMQISRPGAFRSDEQAGMTVIAALRNDPALRGAKISVRVVGNVVYLEGSALSNLQRESAEAAALQAIRNGEVVDNLRIERTLGPSYIQLAE